MNAQQFRQLLNNLDACSEAKEWADGKTWQQVYETCHRGDWLLWLYRKSKAYDFQKLTLAKGLCANTVRHLIKDERSIKAVDAAIQFGKGEISADELKTAYAAADVAAYAAADASFAADVAAYAAADASFAAADAAAAASYTAAYDAAAAYTAAYVSAYGARKENQQKTADIVREVLPFEIWEF